MDIDKAKEGDGEGEGDSDGTCSVTSSDVLIGGVGVV